MDPLAQNLHRQHGDQLAALGGDLVDHQLVGQDHDGDAGDAGLVRLAGDDGLDVIALAGEQPGHLAEDTGDIPHQDGQGVQLFLFIKFTFQSVHPLN